MSITRAVVSYEQVKMMEEKPKSESEPCMQASLLVLLRIGARWQHIAIRNDYDYFSVLWMLKYSIEWQLTLEVGAWYFDKKEFTFQSLIA